MTIIPVKHVPEEPAEPTIPKNVRDAFEQAKKVNQIWHDLKEEDSKLRILVDQLLSHEDRKHYVQLCAELNDKANS